VKVIGSSPITRLSKLNKLVITAIRTFLRR
jgi:hypothetical protein